MSKIRNFEEFSGNCTKRLHVQKHNFEHWRIKRKLSSFLLVDGCEPCESPARTAVLTQQTQIKTEHDPGTLSCELTVVYRLVY